MFNDPREEGIGPVKLFHCRDNDCNVKIFPKELGNVPLKLLYDTWNSFNVFIPTIEDGNVPVKKLAYRDRNRKPGAVVGGVTAGGE